MNDAWWTLVGLAVGGAFSIWMQNLVYRRIERRRREEDS